MTLNKSNIHKKNEEKIIKKSSLSHKFVCCVTMCYWYPTTKVDNVYEKKTISLTKISWEVCV